jgi:DNA-binding MarR family transcriptional regulator
VTIRRARRGPTTGEIEERFVPLDARRPLQLLFDGKALAAFSTDDLSIPEIDELDRRIMESLARGDKTLDSLSGRLGISKPTAWRRLRRLERAGMVKLSKGRRREITVELTERGRLYCEVLSGVGTTKSTSMGEGLREPF